METAMTYGSKRRINQRKMTLIIFVAAVTFLVAVAVGGIFCGEAAQETDFSRKNMMPGFQYLFGTDWLGRDMFVRTIKGLSMSILIGVCAASVSAFVALVLGIAAATLGRKVDAVITWFIDLIMGIPHMLLLILICVALGKGLTGVIVGVALTHWTSLARVIRAEVMQLKESQYIKIAEKLGHS